MRRNCLYCSDKLFGRSDKKFCCDDCRSAYHYQHHKEARLQFTTHHRHLKKNWKILMAMLQEGTTSVSLDLLKGAGFSFLHCTGIHHHPTLGLCLHCYDILYRINESENELQFMNSQSHALKRVS